MRQDETTSPPDPPEEPNEAVPERIGPYKILSVLGEGGMGTVYLAEQKEPVRRRVALKVIKLGMDSKQVLQRFEAERQALAMMEHSSIAKVFEAGTTDRGQPFFVMEYVRGIPITEHCDQHNISIEERIELFRKICSGVQHAHQKGVMHRDLKPSNVLVSVQEGKAIPKIIDFGLARATDHQLIQATIFTEQGLILGTPEYMSPEQAGMAGQDIDTRTDVYSLGVLLYELLVGELPFSGVELRRVGQLEMQRKIKEDEPPKPSTRLSTQGEASEHAARHRRTDTKSLLRRMRGDLDWVVMRAIEKDRTRRYETPAALADDLQRHLEYEPVLAGPPSAGYRLKKLARKYRTQVTAASFVFLALVGGIIGTSVGFARAKTAEEATEQRAAELAQVVAFQETQLGDVDAERMGADLRKAVIAEARAAMEGSGIEQDILDEQQATIAKLLEGVNFTNLALDTLEANIFARALAAIDEKFTDQPLVMARLLQAEANILSDLGLLASASDPQMRALAIRRRELGDDHPDTLLSVNNMGLLLDAQGKLVEAERYHVEALEALRRTLGDDHPDTLASLNNMGALLGDQGKHSEAEPYLREALEGQRRVLGDDHPDTLLSVNNMGFLLKAQGKLVEAEPYYREGLEGLRRVLGDDHPSTLTSLGNLGAVLQAQGKFAEAEPCYREALEGKRRVLGDDHPSTLVAIGNMGFQLHAQGKFVEAEPYYREALESKRRVLGDDHPDTLASINNMGALLHAQGKLVETEPYYREALERKRRVLGDDHPDTLISINELGALLQAQGKHAESELYLVEALEGKRRVLGDDHPSTLSSINEMGVLLQAQGKLSEAEPYYREALEGKRRVLGDDHPDTLTSIGNMGVLVQVQGKFAEAEPYYSEALEGYRRVLGDDHPSTLVAIGNMGFQLHAQGKLAEAELYLREAVERSRRVLGDDHPNTLTSINHLGVLLEAQGKYAEAEPYLVDTLEGSRRLLGEEHPDVAASLRALINLREQRGNYLAADELRLGNAGAAEGETHQIRMSAIADGEVTAESSEEWLHAAYHLYGHGLYVAADLTFDEALDDGGSRVREKHRYNAARAAIRAGAGEGEGAEDLSNTERLDLSRKGRTMLREELAHWREMIVEGDAQTARQRATWSTVDPDLACVRDAAALSKLDDAEAEAWGTFWREVEELL